MIIAAEIIARTQTPKQCPRLLISSPQWSLTAAALIDLAEGILILVFLFGSAYAGSLFRP
jgi:hypothetical protein